MNMVLEYIGIVEEIDIIQETLDNKKKVKQNNKLADRLRKIASDIDTLYPEMKEAFYQLLFHEKSAVRGWVAHHILEVMNYDNKYRQAALKEIAYIAAHDNSIRGLGNRMWLEQWIEQHPTDKDLV